jgi:hypothetical protein
MSHCLIRSAIGLTSALMVSVHMAACRDRTSARSSRTQLASADTLTLVDNFPESERFGADSVRWATFRLKALQENVVQYYRANRRPPTSLADATPIPPGSPVRGSYRYDPWGTAVQYRQTSSGFTLRSAGPDRAFETSDDIIIVGSVGVTR